jgi:hypothetical protein
VCSRKISLFVLVPGKNVVSAHQKICVRPNLIPIQRRPLKQLPVGQPFSLVPSKSLIQKSTIFIVILKNFYWLIIKLAWPWTGLAFAHPGRARPGFFSIRAWPEIFGQARPWAMPEVKTVDVYLEWSKPAVCRNLRLLIHTIGVLLRNQLPADVFEDLLLFYGYKSALIFK